ncbi:MarR family protein [Corynebacterium capitovis DSM 44611]|uniref:helix-turn-helix transcriptional regulator n=1 Tax=Corynebacterium capitovis TaxID=131081 RepID=UPI00036B4540|nr:MarR family transcriptional regulator [Corynebacterium capitovis]WKD57632.1 MarR family protein [Corynebacterium capitovis DSM 44611]
MEEQPRLRGRDTRHAVLSELLAHGPVTASAVGESLGLTAAGARRHLEKLAHEGLAEECPPRAVAGEEAGRGRPAKHYRLTEAGKNTFGTDYDSLAADALSALARAGGDNAVLELARERMRRIFDGIDPSDDPADTARQLADALDRNGYAAKATRVGAGIQLCQHHCPISAVAAAHPEMCEAEHEAISQLTGRHVQPLALITRGSDICTTNIPLNVAKPADGTHTERSGDLD